MPYYIIEPRKLNSNNEVISAAGPDDEAEFYSVYARGITSFYGAGKGGPDSKNLSDHLSDFPDHASAQAFSQHLIDNAPALKALENKEPVTVAGVHYSASHDGKYYTTDGNRSADGHRAVGYEKPTVHTWEIERYLKTGMLSPELAANATTHSENLARLNAFDKKVLRNFAASAQQDPYFKDFHKLGADARTFTLYDMPMCLQEFVCHEKFFDIASPLGGLNVTGIAEGVTLLYSTANAPGELRTGVLMHNSYWDNNTNDQRLDVLNDKGLHERLYTGPDHGATSPHNRIAAVVGYITPTDELLFVAGVGADGKIVDNPKDAQSFRVFQHYENWQLDPVGTAVTMDLAEQLKTQIEKGLAPEPVASHETVAALIQLRKNIGPISPLLMDTANMERVIARTISGHQDADKWQHLAHAHLDRAQTHLDAIAKHTAVIECRCVNNMTDMSEKAKAIYADTLLRKNPDLREHYAQATDNMKKAQNAAFMMNKEDGKTDPALLEKANKVLQTAGKLPDMEAGASSGLFDKIISFAQQDQTMRKP